MHDKIWFTYKSRIRTQQRLAKNDFHSQLLMVWYALLGACLAVTSIKHPTILGGDTDLFSALFSIGLLAISLVVANRDFRGRSIEMRRNYLDLQCLYRNATVIPAALVPHDIDAEYQKLLDAVENHAEIDDKYFRVFQPGLATRVPTWIEFVEVYAYMAVRTIVLAALYLVPAYLMLIKVFS